MGLVYALVDTCVLADIVRQYDPRIPHKSLGMGKFLRKDMLKVVNSIIEDEDESTGFIVASVFAFVELINKCNSIFGGEITNERLLSIIGQPPSWLIIEDMKEDTAVFYSDVPNSVNGSSVSSDDSVHIATAMQRGDDILFLTTDSVLCKLSIPHITFLSS